MTRIRGPNILKLLAIMALVAMFGACGGEGSYTPDPSQLAEDTEQPLSYPAGPYGTSVGSVIEDHKFDVAIYDPAMLCKSGEEHRLADSQGTRTLTMGQLYRGSKWCSNKPVTLAWIAVTTGW